MVGAGSLQGGCRGTSWCQPVHCTVAAAPSHGWDPVHLMVGARRTSSVEPVYLLLEKLSRSVDPTALLRPGGVDILRQGGQGARMGHTIAEVCRVTPLSDR